MKRKVYLVYEVVFINDKFMYDTDRCFFTSKNAAALWLEREKIRRINHGWTICDEDLKNCTFVAKRNESISRFNLWSGIPQ